jgi:hypothetical protein
MEYINEKMKSFAMNISDFEIDQELIDSEATICKTKNKNFTASDGKTYEIENKQYDGSICKITNKTLNSIEVLINKKCFVTKVNFIYIINENTDDEATKIAKIDDIQSNGVNCKQWFTMDNFNKRFKKI